MVRRTVLAFLVLGSVVSLAACGDDSTGVTITGTAAPPATCDPPADGRATISSGGLTRDYLVHVPEDLDVTAKTPLIVSLHGLGQDIARHDLMTGLPDEATARGYVVVTPQGAPLQVPDDAPNPEVAARLEGVAFWNFLGSTDASAEPSDALEGLSADDAGTDDVAFVGALLDEVMAGGCIDEELVFATGMSNGAGMSTTLGCELADLFTAIAPVAGVNLTARCPGDEPMPVLSFHGNADGTVGYEGNFLLGFALGNPSVPQRMASWAQRNGCDPEPEVDRPVAGAIVSRWRDCDEGATVELWTLEGWDHSWPRGADSTGPGSVDATDRILDFFDEFTSGARA